jgi:hypothetical protein
VVVTLHYVCLLYALEGIQGLNEGARDIYESLYLDTQYYPEHE